MTRVVHWYSGDEATCRAVEAWLAAGADADAETLADSARRRCVRLQPAHGPALLVKHFRIASGPHPLLERGKRALAWTAAAREWRNLCRLQAAGLAVPVPLARARLADGDELVVTSFVAGDDLDSLLKRKGEQRRQRLCELAARTRALHGAGFVHGDLHPGNVRVAISGPVLIDLQRVRRPLWPAHARIQDLARLDFSLAGLGVSLGDRLRVRRIALGLGDDASPQARHALRAIGAASAQATRRHRNRRTRDCLRPGTRQVRVQVDDRRGLRRSDCSEAWLREILAAHAAALGARDARVLEDDARGRVTRVSCRGREAVVKEVHRPGIARRLGDAWRGSPARRAWLAGHGLRLRGIEAAEPLAFLESRLLDLPARSWLVLEAVGSDSVADVAGRAGLAAGPLGTSLCRLLVALHRAGIVHGDLKASNLRVEGRGDRLRIAPIDLDRVRFVGRVRDRRRILDLAQLNASLADESLGAEPRLQIFDAYAQRLPFAAGPEAALAAIVRESLARHHRWRGHDCSSAAPLSRGRRRATGKRSTSP